MQLALHFDYSSLDTETRIVVQQKTGEIRDRVKRAASDIVEIGERLIDVKERLGHGRFTDWLHAEFDWSERTARNLMSVADAFKSANFADLNIAPSALIVLSAPSVPKEARNEAISLAEEGQQISHAKAKQIKAKYTPKTFPAKVVDQFSDYENQSQEDQGEILNSFNGLTQTVEVDSEEDDEDEEDDYDFELENIHPSEELVNRFLDQINDFFVTTHKRGGIVVLSQHCSRQKITCLISRLEDLTDKATRYVSQLKEVYK